MEHARGLPLLVLVAGLLGAALLWQLGPQHDALLDDLPGAVGLLAGFVIAGRRFVSSGAAEGFAEVPASERPRRPPVPDIAASGWVERPVARRRRVRAALLAHRLVWHRRIVRRVRRRARPTGGASLASPPPASPRIRSGTGRADLFDRLGYHGWWLVRALHARHRSARDGLIVIGGAPRSGTTLLRTVLGRHPAIASLRETTVFLRQISPPAEIARRLGWQEEEILAWQRASRSQVEFIERMHEVVLARSGKPVWAEKTPRNVMRFGFVRRAFPQAKLVHILRDGRDMVCSLRHKPFAKLDGAPPNSPAAALRCGVQWRDAVRAGLRHRGDPAYWELRYEDLVRRPEPTLRALLDFLDLPWNDRLLVPEEAGADADERRAADAISAGSVGRWRDELSFPQCMALEPLIGPLLEALGYADGPGWSWAVEDTPLRF